MKNKYSQMAIGGTNRAQSTLKGLKPIQENIKQVNVNKETVDDLTYLMKLKGKERDIFRGKYDKVVNNPYFDQFGIKSPGFDSIYEGKDSFKLGDTSMGIKDLNAFFAFQSLLNSPQGVNIPFNKKKGGK